MTMIESPAIPDTKVIDGVLMHIRYQFRRYVNQDGRLWQEGDGAKFEEHDELPHACVIGLETDSGEELDRKRLFAIQTRADFWHPRMVTHPDTGERAVIGWLTNGVRRTREWAANLGTDVILREKRITPVKVADEDAPAAKPKAGKELTNGA